MKSAIEDSQFYDVWSMEIPVLSPRSMLYKLPPVGVGTRDVESLSGYISRLSQEHSLSPVVLLKNSILDPSELPKSVLQNSFCSAFGGSLNGFGTNTVTITNTLQKATTRNDICSTSLLSWKNAVSKYKLLKKHLAWCPVCFEEQRENSEIVYEKLIWSFYSVNACHAHEFPLVENCPHCFKKLKVLSGRSRPGYCAECQKWLGSSLINYKNFKDFKNADEKKREIWRAVILGDMLTKLPLLLINNRNEFIKNLTWFINTFANRSINDFAYKTGMWHISIRRLLKGDTIPTVETILRLCLPLNISPTELFENRDDLFAKNTHSKNTAKLICKKEIKIYLASSLKEYPPSPASEISRRIVWSPERLKKNFPGEYKEIVENYTEYTKQKLSKLSDNEVEMVLIDALKKKPPPSLQSVFRSIGCSNTGYRYYQRFPELCAKVAERYKKLHLKRFNVERAEEIIQIALKENPAPSFSEVARRIGCTREHLREKFPEKAMNLNQRYKTKLINFGRQNRQQLNDEVRKVLIDLQMEKSVISMNQVEKLLPRKWNSIKFKEAYRAITKEMNLMTEK